MRVPFFFLLLALSFLSACSKVPGGTSNVSFRIPSVSELNAKALPQEKAGDVGTLSIPSGDIQWAKACFMINVTASDLAPTSASAPQCSIPTGVFKGSAEPGGVIELSIPKGLNRKIEVIAYFRASTMTPCLTGAKSVNDFDIARTSRLGMTTATIAKDVEEVDVHISLPSGSDTIVSQYNLPAACGPAVTPGSAFGPRAVSGAVVRASSNGNFVLEARVSAPLALMSTSAGGYKLIRRGK